MNWKHQYQFTKTTQHLLTNNLKGKYHYLATQRKILHICDVTDKQIRETLQVKNIFSIIRKNA